MSTQITLYSIIPKTKKISTYIKKYPLRCHSAKRVPQNSFKENTYEINKQVQLLKENTANINNTLDDTISLSTKRLENITVATSNQIKTMAEEMEKLCVRKIEKLDNTLIEEFTDALSCLAGQLVTISEGFSGDYYRLLEELKEAFAQNDVVSTIDNEVISEGDK